MNVLLFVMDRQYTEMWYVIRVRVNTTSILKQRFANVMSSCLLSYLLMAQKCTGNDLHINYRFSMERKVCVSNL